MQIIKENYYSDRECEILNKVLKVFDSLTVVEIINRYFIKEFKEGEINVVTKTVLEF